jgi:hypothetical protein
LGVRLFLIGMTSKEKAALLIVAVSIVPRHVRHSSITADWSCGRLIQFNLLVHAADFQVLFFDACNGRFHALAQSVDCSLMGNVRFTTARG